MRRTLIAVLAVLSLVAGAVTAQTEHKTQSPASIRSDSGIKTSDGKTHLKGNVRIVLEGGVVTADEAVYDESSRQVELVGHVRLQFPPPASQAPPQ